MKAVVGIVAIFLMIGAPNVMASQGYWSASDSGTASDRRVYHLFLVGTYPSSKFIGAELVNQNLTACLDFSGNDKPIVCHRIKPSEIPSVNDSVIDAGFFIVPRSLNASNAVECVQVGYRNLYSCSHDVGIADRDYLSYSKLYYDLSDIDMIYQEARAYNYCIHDHPEDDLNWCVRQVT